MIKEFGSSPPTQREPDISRIKQTLCEKGLNTKFFLVRIFPYSVRIRENADQKKTPYLETFYAVKEHKSEVYSETCQRSFQYTTEIKTKSGSKIQNNGWRFPLLYLTSGPPKLRNLIKENVINNQKLREKLWNNSPKILNPILHLTQIFQI